MGSSSRKITMFILVLAAAIYFLRPTSKAGRRVDLALTDGVVSVPAPAAVHAGVQPSLRGPAARGLATSRPSAPKDVAPPLEKEILRRQIQADKLCYESEACDFPKTDPKSYALAIGKKLALELSDFHQKFGKDFPEESRALANDFVSNNDGFVQEAALKVLHELPTNAQSLKAVAAAVVDSADPGIVQQGMEEMQRYLGSPEEAAVHAALTTLLSTGGSYSSQAASQGILPFIDPQSLGIYQKALATLNPNSEVARNLKSALREYQRLHSGG